MVSTPPEVEIPRREPTKTWSLKYTRTRAQRTASHAQDLYNVRVVFSRCSSQYFIVVDRRKRLPRGQYP